MSTKKTENLISQAEAARIKGVSRQAINKMVKNGRLAVTRIGGNDFVHLDEVQSFAPNSPGRMSADEELEFIKSEIAKYSNHQKEILFLELRKKWRIHPLEEEFGAPAETILEAISRSSDLTKRGVRGIIAEASFKVDLVDGINAIEDITPEGDFPYDYLLRHKGDEFSVQVKMQRLKNHRPMAANEGYKFLSDDFWTVETQRTRGGRDPRTGKDTRPYAYGEFDLLAVSLHPSTGRWSDFLITVSDWLLPRPEDENQLLKFQPVPKSADKFWTDDLLLALDWKRNRKGGRIKGLK